MADPLPCVECGHEEDEHVEGGHCNSFTPMWPRLMRCNCMEYDDGEVKELTSELTRLAQAALEGTTPGPWIVNQEGWACISSASDSVFHGYYESACPSCGAEISDNASVAISIEDAEFIAAARTLVPELVSALEDAYATIRAFVPSTGADKPPCIECGAIVTPGERCAFLSCKNAGGFGVSS